jgi:peptidoglycan L-alanyl-D-glutamate endopeptidase CwlK
MVRLAERALSLSKVDFVVTEGLRTVERQRELVDAGASRTMNSRHITGHAIDVVAWVGGVRWDFGLYLQIAAAFRDASKVEGVPVRWGGAWQILTPNRDPARMVQEYTEQTKQAGRKPFIDAGHMELPVSKYPA